MCVLIIVIAGESLAPIHVWNVKIESQKVQKNFCFGIYNKLRWIVTTLPGSSLMNTSLS